MRQSNRTKILESAVAVIQRDGVTAVTLESVAAEAGVTKGGLMYHFRTRDALLLAIHQHLADQWEASMIDAAGVPPQQATAEQRLAAYALVTSRSSSRAELLLMAEASTQPDYAAIWSDVLARWTPPAVEAMHDPVALARFVARLAADGLWMYDSTAYEPLPPQLRQLVAEHIAQTITNLAPTGSSQPPDPGAKPSGR